MRFTLSNLHLPKRMLILEGTLRSAKAMMQNPSTETTKYQYPENPSSVVQPQCLP